MNFIFKITFEYFSILLDNMTLFFEKQVNYRILLFNKVILNQETVCFYFIFEKSLYRFNILPEFRHKFQKMKLLSLQKKS
jgi:hypothetical protein